MSKFLKIFAPAATGTFGALAIAYAVADQMIVDIPAPIREAIAVAEAQAEEQAAAVEVANKERMMSGLAPSVVGGYGIGRAALPQEVAAWDTDIRPDGLGLPVGSGDVYTGEEIFVEKCAACHGEFGEAVGRWPMLAGGQGTLTREDPVKTIGSYWPYLSTVWDYVHRAMPFGAAESLTDDEVYAITAYLMYVNNLVDDDFELSNENFLEVRLPNEENFYLDDRIETEFSVFVREPCMTNCKDSVEITMHASVLDVTPEETAARKAEEAAMAEKAVMTEEKDSAAVEVAMVDNSALIEAGEGVFRQCKACHQIGEGASNRTGPALMNVIGSPIGSVDGFKYSAVFAEAAAAGEVWNEDNMAAFLANPREAMKGTKMSFRGLRKQEEIDALIAYLKAN